VAAGLQMAVRVEDAPEETEEGNALRVHLNVGVVGVVVVDTSTVTVAVLLFPTLLVPVTL
jgi:hypothetical protein